MLQQTIRDLFTFEGVGIHTGKHARVEVRPAAANTGRQFVTSGVTIPAHVNYALNTPRCTTLGRDGASVAIPQVAVHHVIAIRQDHSGTEADFIVCR